MTKSVDQYNSSRTVFDFATLAYFTHRMEYHHNHQPFFAPIYTFQKTYATVVVDSPGNNMFLYLLPKPRHDTT